MNMDRDEQRQLEGARWEAWRAWLKRHRDIEGHVVTGSWGLYTCSCGEEWDYYQADDSPSLPHQGAEEKP